MAQTTVNGLDSQRTVIRRIKKLLLPTQFRIIEEPDPGRDFHFDDSVAGLEARMALADAKIINKEGELMFRVEVKTRASAKNPLKIEALQVEHAMQIWPDIRSLYLVCTGDPEVETIRMFEMTPLLLKDKRHFNWTATCCGRTRGFDYVGYLERQGFKFFGHVDDLFRINRPNGKAPTLYLPNEDGGPGWSSWKPYYEIQAEWVNKRQDTAMYLSAVLREVAKPLF